VQLRGVVGGGGAFSLDLLLRCTLVLRGFVLDDLSALSLVTKRTNDSGNRIKLPVTSIPDSRNSVELPVKVRLR